VTVVVREKAVASGRAGCSLWDTGFYARGMRTGALPRRAFGACGRRSPQLNMLEVDHE
jgi:hypothetical protein